MLNNDTVVKKIVTPLASVFPTRPETQDPQLFSSLYFSYLLINNCAFFTS